MSLAIEKQEEEQREGEAQIQGIAVWGANISSPVVDHTILKKSILE